MKLISWFVAAAVAVLQLILAKIIFRNGIARV